MAAGSAVPAHADLTGGVWHRGDGNARVRISSCGQAFCAVNVWIKNPGNEKAGDRLIMNVKQTAPGRFSGTSFDPQRNLRFSTQIRLNGNSMTTSGCILGGFICRSQQWTRR
ncbi:MAG: DUF2147 domain-containing protein [Alphaproteobacteria bacterium]|nr:DUF2147 domain-containing protein [Alphaproteobacteria bacterium]